MYLADPLPATIFSRRDDPDRLDRSGRTRCRLARGAVYRCCVIPSNTIICLVIIQPFQRDKSFYNECIYAYLRRKQDKNPEFPGTYSQASGDVYWAAWGRFQSER